MERHEARRRALSGPARTSALAPFRIRNYRFQWPADLFTSWAFEMEVLVLGWYIMVETGSVLLLTVLASLNYGGTLIAPVLGVIGDRIGHRDLLAAMRACYAVLAGTLLTLALTGYLTPFYVMVIVAVMGLIRPSDLGVRGALVADIMPQELMIGAISVSRTTMDTARIAGALTGTGLFAVLGIAPAYMAIVSLYLVATVLSLCVVAPAKPHHAVHAVEETDARSPLRDLKEGLAYVWGMPHMRADRYRVWRIPSGSDHGRHRSRAIRQAWIPDRVHRGVPQSRHLPPRRQTSLSWQSYLGTAALAFAKGAGEGSSQENVDRLGSQERAH